ncbi:hypothetical protein K438DRAFT_1967664 [Mycena galopus ATCC 62051]|nr:hypothetical protein K438DRAFT_1983051 [Mycena galopus ATCC 62051]KAF8196641.1 hypothetical protein K438DRAFT_1967664 [Mycena galopus ATCC 62051]
MGAEDAPIDKPAIPEPEPRSEDELRASIHKFIFGAHCRVEQCKRGTKSTPTSGLLDFFAECRDQAVVESRLILGRLPHLLLSLHIAHTRARKETKQIQTEFKSAHEAIEALNKKLTDVQRTLTAEIRERRNLSDLEKLAEQTVTLPKLCH